MNCLRQLMRPKPLLLLWAVMQYPIVMWEVWFPEPDGACAFYTTFWDTPLWLVLSLVIAAFGLWLSKSWSCLLAIACCADLIYRHLFWVLGFEPEARVFSEGGDIIWINLLAWWKFLAQYNPTFTLQFSTAVVISIYAAASLVRGMRRQGPVLP